MAQKLIKVNLDNATGIYFIDENFSDSEVNSGNAPKGRGSYKFVIRQTVTIQGVGKKTIKETIIKHGLTFNKALEAVIIEREPMRKRAINKVLGVTDDIAEQQKLDVVTVDEVWKEFYKEHEEKKTAKPWSKTYLRTADSLYRNYIKPNIGDMRAIQVKHKDIKSLLQKVRSKSLSVSIERNIIGILRPMFIEWIITNDLEKVNPAKDHKLRKQEDREVVLNWDQMEKLYTALFNYRDERIRQVFLWLATGRRINEVLTLRHEHLEGEYYTVKAENNKVGKDMMYRIPNGVTLPLYKGYIHKAPRNRDKHLTDVTMHRHWLAIQTATGLHDLHKHDLRHIIATVLTDSLVPSDLVRRVLGHLLTGTSKKYIADTVHTADLKHKAVTFFLDKVFNKVDRGMMWDEYLRNNEE